MADHSIGINRGAVGYADAQIVFSGEVADPVEVDTLVDTADTAVDAAKALTAALETDTIAVDASVDGNKVLSAALEVDTGAAVAAEPDDTAVIAAIGVLQADGASPTEAHVDDLQSAWDTFKSAFDAYNVLVGALDTDATALDADIDATKVLSAALETDAIAADAALDTTVTASQAAQVASAALAAGTTEDLNVLFKAAAGWTRAELYVALKVIADKLVAPGSPDADSKFPVI